MPAKPKPRDTPAELRRRAEKHTMTLPSKTNLPKTEVDTQRLLHELEVHQIELEMQNAELRIARDEAESVMEKYSALYDFAPVGYFTILADGSIRMVNLAGAALVGIARSLVVGQFFGNLVSSNLRSSFGTFLHQVFAGNAAPLIESELLCKGQPERSVTIHVQLSPDGQECSMSVTDITGRKRDEDAVRVSEIRYRRLFEAAHDGVLLMDPATRKITDANPYMTKLLGYTHEELVGKELFEIGLLEDEAASQEMFRNLKNDHQVRYEDLPLESEGGRHQEVEVVANLYQENGRPVIQCNIRDITQRKQAEDALRRNEALFSGLIVQAPVGVLVLDAGFRLQQANPVSLKTFSNIDRLIGRDFAEILRILWPKRVAAQTMAHFRHTLKTGEPYRTPDFTHRRRDIGLKEIYEWQIERVTLPAGEYGVVCFFNNITERIKADSAQRRLDLMAASNLKLKREIVHRLAVEEKLRETESVQGSLLKKSLQQQIELRGMSHKILHAQEDERRRISRELHDVIAQTLVGINVHISALAQETTAELGSIQQRIADTHQMVERSVEIVHQFARELRPTVLDDLGLIPALQAFLKGFMETTGIRVSLKISPSIEESSENLRITFYRIIQEALTNVAKHAKASMVEICIQRLADSTSLKITDNGHGFEIKENIPPKQNKRLGLLGMRERAEMVGGVFSIESAIGEPTTIEVVIKTEPQTANKKFSRKAVKPKPTTSI